MGSKKMFFILLIIVAIAIIGVPVILRTITNSRVKTFNSTISQYITAVKNAYTDSEIQCYDGYGNLLLANALGDGEFFVPMTSSKSNEIPKNYASDNTLAFDEKIPNENSDETIHMIAQDNSQELLKKGGKSPFGSDMYGYIKIVKKDIDTTYEAHLIDTSGHSMENEMIINNQKISYAPADKQLYICKYVIY